MDALRELFTTAIGLAALAVIVGAVVMGIAMNRWFARQMTREEAQRRAEGR